MIFMIKRNGVNRIDYKRTSWMEESFRMAGKGVSRATFDAFKQAVTNQDDKAVMDILASVCVSVKYYF